MVMGLSSPLQHAEVALHIEHLVIFPTLCSLEHESRDQAWLICGQCKYWRHSLPFAKGFSSTARLLRLTHRSIENGSLRLATSLSFSPDHGASASNSPDAVMKVWQVTRSCYLHDEALHLISDSLRHVKAKNLVGWKFFSGGDAFAE